MTNSARASRICILRFGELLLTTRKEAKSNGYLEDAMRLYDRAGDVDHLHMVVRSFMRSTESKGPRQISGDPRAI